MLEEDEPVEGELFAGDIKGTLYEMRRVKISQQLKNAPEEEQNF